MLLGILLTVQIIICVAMGALILIQRSEGGALGMGGGPSGFMSARGAGNLLTRMTGILAFLFFANCIALTVVGNLQNRVKSAVDQADMSKLTLPVGNASQSAAASSSTSSAPSLADLPLGAPAQTPASVTPQAVKPAAGAPLPSLPSAVPASKPGASQKQVEAAKSAIWQSAPAGKTAASGVSSSSAAQ